jgi:hypothetical protein
MIQQSAHGGRCEQPYEPYYTAEGGPYDPLPSGYPGDPFSADLSFGVDYPPLDTDGDGEPDVISETPGVELAIERSDGTVRIRSTETDGPLRYDEDVNYGDLDADGRDDIVVGLWDGAVPVAAFLIAGTVTPGLHDPAEVGVRLSAWEEFDLLAEVDPVGDQDGDGADDLLFDTGPGIRSAVFGGPALLGPGPGGELAAFPPPIRELPNGHAGLLELTDGVAAIVELEQVDAAVVELRISASPEIRLRTARIDASVAGLVEPVRAYRAGDHRIVSLWLRERNHYAVWLWDLDDPCARATIGSTTTTTTTTAPPPPPAQPVPDPADFTG